MLPLPPFAPQSGAIQYQSRSLALALVPAAATPPLVPGVFPDLSVDPAVYRWPKEAFCTGMLLLPLSGLAADVGNLALRWQDETAYDVINDGQGTTFEGMQIAWQSTELGRYFPVQRPVMGGDEWLFRVFNHGATPIRLAGLFFIFQDPREQAGGVATPP